MRWLPVLLLVLRVASATGQSAPPMPQHLTDYCAGESCHFRCGVRITKPVELRLRDERAAPIVARLDAGDTALTITGNAWVRRPGLVVLRRDTLLATDDGEPREDTLRLTRADTLYLIAYGELGSWHWWVHGRAGTGTEFWNGPAQRFFGRARGNLAGLSLNEPDVEWWLRLEGSGGRAGWWRAEPGHIEVRPGEDSYCAIR